MTMEIEFGSGWTKEPLGKCCTVVSGATPRTDNPEYWGGAIPWVTPKDLSRLETPYLEDSPVKITDSGYRSCSTTMLPAGSVLFSSRAPIGLTAITTRPMCTNQGFKSLVPGPNVDSLYLYYWLRSMVPIIQARGTGTTFKEISKPTMEEFAIPLPPIVEQRRIGQLMLKADSLCRKRQEAIRLGEEFLRSVFLEMFGDPVTNPKGWEVRQLMELVRHGDSINYGVVQPGDDTSDGIPLIRVGDLVGGKVNTKGLKKIATAIEAQYSRSRLRGDEVLVSCVGSTGIVSIADESVKGFNIARAVARIPVDDSVDRLYLAAYLRTEAVQRYFIQELRTVSQPTLNIKQISETQIQVPPYELQQEFARRVVKFDGLRDRIGITKASLSMLNGSLQNLISN